MYTWPYTNFPFFKHENIENGDHSLYQNTKIVKTDAIYQSRENGDRF